MSGGPLRGRLFDGRTTAAVEVQVSVEGGRVRVDLPSGEPRLEAAVDRLRVSDPFASAPRQLTFEDGSVVEVTDGAALTALLSRAGRPPGLVDRLQQRWAGALAALLVAAGLLALGYLQGLPALARAGAAALPRRLERKLGAGVLELLDAHFLEPSTLPEGERDALAARLGEAAARGAPGVEPRIQFRRARTPPGVNAFALPGGDLVLLDELVARTGGDDRLLAVVGHELGHLARRHPTQRLIQAGGLGAAASLIWGDFSMAVANVPAVLALLDYSRDAEREADGDAATFLRALGRDERALFDAFCLLDDAEREARLDGLPSLLSTHPVLEERLESARGGHADWSCPTPDPDEDRAP